MNARDMNKATAKSAEAHQAPAAPTALVDSIDAALDSAFKAPFIDRGRLRKELIAVFLKHRN